MTEPSREELSERLIARLTTRAPTGATRLLGCRPLFIDAAAGVARLGYDGKAEFCDHRGAVHGGFLAAMMDEAMAIAAAAHRDFGQIVPTLAMKTSYLEPVRPGALTAEGSVRHAGEQLVYLEGKLFDPDGRLCATCSATARFRKAPWL